MSNTRYEIQVNINGQNQLLDTYDYDPISLTFDIADINDISNRNSSYSKTITIPDTKNNRRILTFISNLGANSTFNPNLKTQCWLLVDTIVVMQGYIQLTSVNNYDDTTGQNYTEYEMVIYSYNDTLFTNIGENYLTDLNWNNLNHIFNLDNIKNSWNTTSGNGYYYPLIDYGEGLVYDQTDNALVVGIELFFPATYVITIVDKIFQAASFSYQSDFFNSDKFTELVIPFNGSQLTIASSSFADNFVSTIGNTYSINIHSNSSINGDWVASDLLKYNNVSGSNYNMDNVWNPSTYVYTSPYDQNTINVSQRFTLQVSGQITYAQPNGVPIFDDQIDLRIFCWRSIDQVTGTTSVFWNTPGVGANGPLSLQSYDFVNYGYPFSLINGVDPYILAYTQQGNPSWTYPPNFTSTIGTVQFFTASGIFNATITTEYLNGANGNPNLANLQQGEQVRFSIEYRTLEVPPGTFSAVQILSGQINNQAVYSSLYNLLIDYSSAIPKQIKQKDFLTSLIKMFNLYIEPSKLYPNTLIIEPRDQYYSTNVFKDWTDKVDINDGIQEEILSNTQDNQTLFTYTQDTDWLNSLYQSDFNQIFGQYIYNIENDFIKDQQVVSVIFSPTPLSVIPGSNEIIIPRLSKDYNNSLSYNTGHVNTNIRILRRYPGLLTLSKGDAVFIIYANGSGSIFEPILNPGFAYPYAGHFDNPYNPTDDINWGQSLTSWIPGTYSLSGVYSIDGVTFSSGTFSGLTQSTDPYGLQNQTTNNTLFNNYWVNSMDEISDPDSRIITVSMYLTPDDIYNFYFSDNIYLALDGSGQYYKVNKIYNYDPGSISSCQVDLLKTISITTPFKRIIPASELAVFNYGNWNSLPNPGIFLNTAQNPYFSPSINISSGQVINQGNNVTIGSNQVINNGNNTWIFGSQVINNGDFNNIALSSNNITINGSSNSVLSGSNLIHVAGNNTIIQPNSSNINVNGNNTVFDMVPPGNTISTPNQNIFSIGNDNEVAYGITNSTLIGNNIIATQSNSLYSSQNIILVNGAELIGSSVSAAGPNGAIQYNLNGLDSGDNNLTWDPLNRIIIAGDGIFINSAVSAGFGENHIINNSAWSFVEGDGNIIRNVSEASHAEGNSNLLDSSSDAHIEGYFNVMTASNFGSHIEGNGNYINNCDTAHAEGVSNNIDSSGGSHVEGLNNTIILGSNISHAEGSGNSIVNSEYAHVEGFNNSIYASTIAHVEGINNIIINSPVVHVEGENNSSTDAFCSHVSGQGASASQYGEWTRSSIDSALSSWGQYGIVQYSGKTTTNTGIHLGLNGLTVLTVIYLSINDGEGYMFSLQGSFKISGGTDYGSIYLATGYFYNTAGTLNWLGGVAPTATITTTAGLIGATINLSFLSNGLVITATGLVATNINWICKLEYTMVKF